MKLPLLFFLIPGGGRCDFSAAQKNIQTVVTNFTLMAH